MKTSVNVTSRLKKEGLKMTPQRKAILETISASRSHMTPSYIYQSVRLRYPQIGLVTVYRTLDVLERLGLVCALYGDDGKRSYLLRRPAGHHHHLICSDCGTVIDFSDCDVSDVAERLSNRTGFEIKGHVLEFSGSCAECREKG